MSQEFEELVRKVQVLEKGLKNVSKQKEYRAPDNSEEIGGLKKHISYLERKINEQSQILTEISKLLIEVKGSILWDIDKRYKKKK